jgi:Ca2+-binding RTX toxin-like protein
MSLISAALIGVAVAGLPLGLAGPASAATVPTTCDGRPATIIILPRADTLAGAPAPGAEVVHPGDAPSPVQGTAGPDVVVQAEGALAVDTLGGDDLICIVGLGAPAVVDAGDGDDTVDATARAAAGVGGFNDTEVILGAGDDTYLGGSARDVVTMGTGDDRVSTAGGNDRVNVGAATNAGAVDLGTPGYTVLDPHDGDQLVLDGTISGGVRAAAGQQERLSLLAPAGAAIDVDDAAGRVTVNGAVTPLSGFDTFDTIGSLDRNIPPAGWASLSFEGSDAAETIDPLDIDRPTVPPGAALGYGPVTIQMGGGADTLYYATYLQGLLDGGSGPDQMEALWQPGISPATGLAINLAQNTISEPGSGVPPATLQAFETIVVAGAPQLSLTGSRRADDITVFNVGSYSIDTAAGADHVRLEDDLAGGHVQAGPGADVVDARNARGKVVIHGGPGDDHLIGGLGPDHIYGNPGNDVLIGNGHDDTLLGGPGHDIDRGGHGHDTCTAEIRRSC